jgi:uncharacterized protein GlcG (DUF336 family)
MKLPLALLACTGIFSVAVAPQVAKADHAQLNADDVTQILAQAATAASQINPGAIIAVTDRDGFVVGLWDASGKLPQTLPPFDASLRNLANVKLYSLVAAAITRASTAAFLSSDQNAFTSRTAGYIIQQHFPPGIRNTPNGPLVGVGLSSLFYSDVNRVKMFGDDFNGAAPVPPTVCPDVRADFFPLTTLNDSPGGVPLYKEGELVGGIGVTGDGSPSNLTPAGALLFDQMNGNSTFTFKTGRDSDEDVAMAGQTGFRPSHAILATNATINGIRIPYVYQRIEDVRDVKDVVPLGTIGHALDYPLPLSLFQKVAPGRPRSSPARYPYPIATLGGYQGEIHFPFRDDPLINTPGRQVIGKKGFRLTAEEVKGIITKVAQRALDTRAGIRLPIGTSMKIFITVVGNPNKNGDIPPLLGIFRTGEATVFSLDVSAQKARTALFFSNKQLAMSSRAVGFLAERFFPPGLDGRPPGPLFGFQEAVSLRRNANLPLKFLAQALVPGPGAPAGVPPADVLVFKDNPFLPARIIVPRTTAPFFGFPGPVLINPVGFPGNPNLPDGITIFPGGFPLYRNGELIGAVGVSGDGVDQDDIAASSGTQDFLPSPNIRSDSYSYHGARLPYVKFPRDPEK